ncbi:FAD/NAD-P-binding domain-containing protein [Gautieria morchelliformis]|nr:FAD/NAD-P-binding domain-containing protein [Gautieria morchelliformis]
MTWQPLKNVLVIGGSYVGSRAAAELALALPSSHRVLLLEPHSHFQHLFTFPRFAVVKGHEHKAFIPFDNFFQTEGVAPEKGKMVRARVDQLLKDKAMLDREVEGATEIPYDYAVVATGTQLPPPGTLRVEGKVEGVEYFRQHQKRVESAQRIVILGGGAVGVQIATDIKETYPSKRVVLVHSRLQLLNRFHNGLHEVVRKRCEELGIELVLGDRAVIPSKGFPIEEGPFEVELQSGKHLSADFAIISIGQTPQSSLISRLSPGSITSNGFISVRPTLQIADDSTPNLFTLGDIAETGANKAARPGMVQAKIVARNIVRLIEGKGEELETYKFDPPEIHLTLGMKKNVIFANPRHDAEGPWCEEKDNGMLDMGVVRKWRAMGAPMHDLHA